MQHFYSNDETYFVKELVEFLKNQEKAGYCQNVEKNEVKCFEGTPKEKVITIVQGKIAKGKRVHFNVFYKGFIIRGKTVSYSHNLLNIDNQAIFLNELNFSEETLSIEVSY